jgi:predicted acetyltransferase
MDLELRAPRADEMDAFVTATSIPFGSPTTSAEHAAFVAGVDRERCLAVFDDDAIVATAGAHSFELTVPGLRRVAAAGVTVVGVHPTHRRRGLLRWMMDVQLDDVARRGEPLALLTASESSIYERFGYGTGTFTTSWELESEHARLVEPPAPGGRVRLARGEDALRVALQVYETVSARSIGEIRRDEWWWRDRVYSPAPAPAQARGDATRGEGGEPFFTAVHESADGTADGFARYAIRQHWPDGVAANVLTVHELHALDGDAEGALWDYLFGIDLIGTIEASARPVDDSLRWRLADPRRIRSRKLRDFLWVRVVDVGGALSARRYGADDSLVLELTDAFRPENGGRWRLEAEAGSASCTRTGDGPDLALSAPDLGALYLGGVSVATLARAGRVRELRQQAVSRADRMFAVHPLPWCTTQF